MIESPKNFIEQFQNFIEHIAGVMKTFLTKEVADNYYLSFTAQTLTDEQKEQVVENLAGTFLPLFGGTMTGGISFSPSTESIELGFPYASGKGALLTFRNENYTGAPGGFDVIARSNGTEKILSGRIDGSLNWGGNPVIQQVYNSGNCIRFSNGIQIVFGSTNISLDGVTIIFWTTHFNPPLIYLNKGPYYNY